MVEDLSKVHRPASGLFPQPAPGAEDAWRLSPEQITFYRENRLPAGCARAHRRTGGSAAC